MINKKLNSFNKFSSGIHEKTKFNILAWSLEDAISLFSVSCFIEEFYLFEDLDLITNVTQKLEFFLIQP